jgi:hypothetical protein
MFSLNLLAARGQHAASIVSNKPKPKPVLAHRIAEMGAPVLLFLGFVGKLAFEFQPRKADEVIIHALLAGVVENWIVFRDGALVVGFTGF